MYIQVKVIPKSRVTEFVEMMEDETYKFRLKSAPEKGRANKELIDFLSKKLMTHKDKISIISGHKEQRKLLKLPDDVDLSYLNSDNKYASKKSRNHANLII